MPKSYLDVTRSGAASAKVQEEGRKPTTPAPKYKRKGGSRQLRLLPDWHLNSHLILTLILVELRFSSSSKERPLL
jgi:hypothetical protein